MDRATERRSLPVPASLVVFRLVQAYLAATMTYGIALGRTGVIFHSGMGLVATLLPAFVARRWRARLPWPLLLWIAVPVFLHSFGIANGLYRADF